MKHITLSYLDITYNNPGYYIQIKIYLEFYILYYPLCPSYFFTFCREWPTRNLRYILI